MLVTHRGDIFAAVARWVHRFLVIWFVALMAAPGALFVQFQVHRAQIEKELCVQREVVEEMRTCHGECVLSKRFKALEREADQGFPAERMVRFEPVTDLAVDHTPVRLPMAEMPRPMPVYDLADGFLGMVEHVPRG